MSGIPAGAGQLLGKRLGKFDILALLALGGTAEIYLARIGGAAGFEKYVVVKCLHDHLADDTEFVKMFLDEARLAAHLDHSNIVQTMELGEYNGRYYMVMEFLAGLSLAMIIRRAAERLPTARIPVPLVLNILAQSAAGLHYAHEKAVNGKALSIVHRDISPQNLVISFEGVVKLVDFGIAKAELRETRTRSGTIKGKFAYMSPEQCVANNVDRRTDVFALGVIGHELLTGRRLFKRTSPYETYQAVLECNVQPPSTIDPEIDPALDPVIMGALTKDKADRYPTAEAFGDALLGYLHHRGVSSSPGDVSRFFDAYFGQEIEEYSGRMRELIAGRDVSVDTGVTWGGDVEDDRRDAEPDGHGSSGEIPVRYGAGSQILLDDLGSGSRVEADDEMPAERTRIETNPLERINELERLAGRAPPDGATRVVPSSAVPVPAPPPGVAAGAAGPPPGPSSGRFPDAANLPTMIDATGEAPRAAALPAHARTHVAPLPVASAMPASGAPAGPAPGMPGHPGVGPSRNGAGLPGLPPAARPAGTLPPSMTSGQPPGAPGMPPPGYAQGHPQSHPQGYPQGYPVLNAELSAQIATGATVFPSDASRGAPPGGPMPQGAAMPGAPGARGSEPGASGPGAARGSEPGAMPGVPPGPPHGPFPGASHGAPSDGYPPGMAPPRPGDGPFDPQRAAGMMSPVGQQYPQNVDWNAMAAQPARAVPPWLLVALFVGAISVALALTIIIARILR